MTKPELGTKRICLGCEAKFYDLHKTPIVCPACQAVFVVAKPAPERTRRVFDAKATVEAAPKSAPAGEDVEVTLVGAGDDKEADGDKEADAGVPLLEEMDED